MRKGPRSHAAHELYDKEEREAKLFLEYLKAAKVQVPQGRLSGGTGFFVSITENDIIRGLGILHKDGVLCTKEHLVLSEPDIASVFRDPKKALDQNKCCVDTKNHAYYFNVISESRAETDRYLAGFAETGRRGKPERTIDLEDLFCYCQCGRFSYGYFTLGGRLRVCKHIFASMCWLVLHVAKSQKQDLPKLKPLIKFVLFSILWVDPKGRYDRLREFLTKEYKALEGMEAAEAPIPEGTRPAEKPAKAPAPVKRRALSDLFFKEYVIELYEGASFERLLYNELLEALLGTVDEKRYRSFIGSINRELMADKEDMQRPGVYIQRKLSIYERKESLAKLAKGLEQKRMALRDMYDWIASQYIRTGVTTVGNLVNSDGTGLIQQLILSTKAQLKCLEKGTVNTAVWERSAQAKRDLLRLVVDYYGLSRAMDADAKGILSLISSLDLEDPKSVSKIILQGSERIGNIRTFINRL